MQENLPDMTAPTRRSTIASGPMHAARTDAWKERAAYEARRRLERSKSAGVPLLGRAVELGFYDETLSSPADDSDNSPTEVSDDPPYKPYGVCDSEQIDQTDFIG